MLSEKYSPTSVQELCIDPALLADYRTFLLDNRGVVFVQRGSGNGGTITTRLICAEHSIDTPTLPLDVGTGRCLPTKTYRNVADAVVYAHRRRKYLVEDVELLSRPERSKTLSHLLRHSVECVIFVSELFRPPEGGSVFVLPPPPLEMKIIHLWWVACSEGIDVEDEFINDLAAHSDLRQAVNSLALATMAQKDTIDDVDDFTRGLCALETLPFTLDEVNRFYDTLLFVDVAEGKSTYDWATQALGSLVHGVSTRRQTALARHAQMCHRRRQIGDACRVTCVHPVDMTVVAPVFRDRLLSGGPPLATRPGRTAQEIANSVYTIAKLNSNATATRALKKRATAWATGQSGTEENLRHQK